MNLAERQGLFFLLSEGILQELALEKIHRKLNQDELKSLRETILHHFKDWDLWIKELISNECGEVENK